MDNLGEKIHIDNIENVENLSIINEPHAHSNENQKKPFYKELFLWLLNRLKKKIGISK